MTRGGQRNAPVPADRDPDHDRRAFDRIFDAHHERLLAFAARRVLSAADAEDVLAETFAVAWRRLDAIPEEPLPWLYGVARRVIANQRRGNRRGRRLANRLAAEPVPESVDPASLVGERSPILEAFAELSEADREVLRLSVWEGLDAAAAAAALSCSTVAFRVRLHRARRRLRDQVGVAEIGPPTANETPRPQEVR